MYDSCAVLCFVQCKVIPLYALTSTLEFLVKYFYTKYPYVNVI